MNEPNYTIATTYLKLLQNQPDLVDVLNNASKGEHSKWLDQDYVSSDDIEPILHAFANSGLDSLVMRLGSSLDSTTHGPLGFTVLSACDLRTALSIFCDYSCIRTTAYHSKLLETPNHLRIIAHDQTGSELVSRWMIEAGMQAAQRLVQNLMGHPLTNNALIRFAHPAPNYAEELESYFGIPCEFEADEHSFSIPASWGSIASPLADAGAYQTNLTICKELKHQLTQQGDVLASVKLRLDTFLFDCQAGKVTPSALPNLATIANELALSPRTLARRLEQQNSSYKVELELARRKQAAHLLLNTHLRIADIAYYLAYQEPANFIRAFKQWYESTPTKWRRSASSIEPR